jgi:hypothetical protein
VLGGGAHLGDEGPVLGALPGVGRGEGTPTGVGDWIVSPSKPGVPNPPPWVETASAWFLMHAAEPVYWILAVTSFAVWGVLRWQRRRPETAAARSFRAFLLAKGWLWLVLAVTRWIAPLWRLPLYGLVVVWILATTVWVLSALVWVYVIPVFRGTPPPQSPLEAVLPEPKRWDGKAERRIGPKDRRHTPTATT